VRRLLALSGAVLAGLLAMASATEARGRASECNRTATGATIKGDLTVPSGGVCRLVNSTVRGDVRVRDNAYVQAINTTVRGDIKGRNAKTIFVEGGSIVKGNVETDRTAKVFLFDSAVGGRIDIARGRAKVHVCGMTVRGDIAVDKSGRDILIGDPLAVDCAGNVVKRGDIAVEDSFTDVELVVRGNTLYRGDLEVSRNSGPSGKFVEGNEGGDDLVCKGNDAPFTASGNTGWDKQIGQCS
jgi:hypothetical protein